MHGVQQEGVRNSGRPQPTPDRIHQFVNWRNSANSRPDSSAAAGRVNTQAAAMFLIVENCSPLLFAAIVPATPELNTCVVLTGSPKLSAAKIVPMATSSAVAPWA